MSSNNKQKKIEIYQDSESKKEYVLQADVQENLYPYFLRINLFDSFEKETNINIVGIEDYLSGLELYKFDISSSPKLESLVIEVIESELLYDVNSKDKYELYFTRLFTKIGKTYDLLIKNLKPYIWYGDDDITGDEYIEKIRVLISIYLFYSLSSRILEFATQLEIDILSIIQRNNLEYLFDEKLLIDLSIIEEENTNDNSHHPLLTNPLTKDEQITLLEYLGIIDYLQRTKNLNKRQLAHIISAIINKNEKNVYDTIRFLDTKESITNKQKNKDTLERILSKINLFYKK
ncbi:MAG: hypothetical protein E6772_14525 [Dysgonomonas sp.]|nr:hypothetical protein [Dysgonomonas sp.]